MSGEEIERKRRYLRRERRTQDVVLFLGRDLLCDVQVAAIMGHMIGHAEANITNVNVDTSYDM
jgi:hypothetical protein